MLALIIIINSQLDLAKLGQYNGRTFKYEAYKNKWFCVTDDGNRLTVVIVEQVIVVVFVANPSRLYVA